MMNIYLIAFLAVLATILGGLIVFRFRKKFFKGIIAFTAGTFLAVAFFNLIPESFELSKNIQLMTLFLAIGFLLFYILQRFAIIHACEEEDCRYGRHEHIGILGASGLIFHSFLDGFAIGLAFQVSLKIALIVSIAVIAHKVGDGIGLVSLMLHHKNSSKRSIIFLLIDAMVPVIGIFLSNFLRLQQFYLGLMLAFFAGFFIYIGASDLLPEAHREDTSFRILISTLAGFVFVYFLNNFFVL
ncbi:ZIP family metal transporter [Candidatus Woesearchaeota archaeon]|nr:ZIP family metal transporter [Candidatus Woesearchaeota archaeon]